MDSLRWVRQRGGEDIEGAFGDEIVGDPVAQGFGCRGVGGFGVDLDHGFAVGRDDLGEHAPLPCFGCGRDAVGADGERAAAAEGAEGGALGLDGEASVGVLEEGDGVADICVAGFVDGVGTTAGFEGEGSLAGCGADLFGGEAVMDRFGALEAVEAGGSEDEGVTLALLEFAETGVDVAADFDEGDVGAEGEDLGAAAWAGGADAASGGEGVERPVLLADPDVAGVGALGDGGESELRGEFCWEVFEASGRRGRCGPLRGLLRFP